MTTSAVTPTIPQFTQGDRLRKARELTGLSSTAFVCPKMVADKGETYTCTAKIDGVPTKITVTVQDDEGSIFWEATTF